MAKATKLYNDGFITTNWKVVGMNIKEITMMSNVKSLIIKNGYFFVLREKVGIR